MDIYFYLILGIAIIAGICFSLITRGILYHTPDTDNELMAYAAAQSHKWKWPSDVHKYSASTRKVSMKEWTIIMLSIFQKILRDKTTDWPYTTMTGLAVSSSTVLIYLISSNYFNSTIGLIVAILYIISFWPWQVSLYGGHVNMANLFFLLSAYSIQMASSFGSTHYIIIVIGGIFLGFCLFSSPSSYKYFIVVFTALFFNEYRGLFASHDIDTIINVLPITNLLFLDVAVLVISLLSYSILISAYKSVVKKIYNQEAPAFLNKFMSGREKFTLEHYIDHANKKIRKLRFWMFWILFTVLIIVNLIPLPTLLALTAGFILVFFILTLPNIKENVTEYLACMFEHKRKTHFRSFVDYFAKRGITVQQNTRGAGLSWVPKLLWTFAPFHTIIFVVILAIGWYKSLSTGNVFESISLIIIAFIALSPIIWAEITKAPQASRLYSPGLITSLLLPAYIFSGITWTPYTWSLFSIMGIIVFAWNLWRFVDDVYPARMATRNLVQIMNRYNISDIYTYQTSFNDAFVGAAPGIGKSKYLPEIDIIPPFKVHYIQCLDEITNGWIAIPGTSSKALTATDEIANGDYIQDPILNRLIETKQIDKIATVKFKTYGTSTIWVHEDDITSYRALHLKDIKPDDLYRGYAWLIDSNKLKNAL